MNSHTKNKIQERIVSKMNSIINRRIKELGSDMDDLLIKNPFGSRLVPEEIWKGSKFECSFVTSFGQGVYEQIAYEIAIGSGAFAENQHKEKVTLNTWQEEEIESILSAQRSEVTVSTPIWEDEVKEITSLKSKRHLSLDTCFDLYIRRDDSSEEYYSLKTVKPNLDQTERAKRDMLRISAAKLNAKTFLALPYSPHGEGKLYEWSLPKKLFDMNYSSAVLIGAAFWNTVGNNENTYRELLGIFAEIGAKYRARITNDFLGKH